MDDLSPGTKKAASLIKKDLARRGIVPPHVYICDDGAVVLLRDGEEDRVVICPGMTRLRVKLDLPEGFR